MPAILPLIGFILGTPARRQNVVGQAIRASLLSTVFGNAYPLFMAGVASAFAALVAYWRLHAPWAAVWLLIDVSILVTRLLCIRAYARRHDSAGARHTDTWAARYAPLCLLATLTLGLGTMGCVISPDTQLSALAIMVTAGILGGIGSRNAAVPRLAIAQIALGAVPIGIGALVAPRSGSWILLPPLVAYLGAMFSVVWRHYDGLLALMSAEQRHAELAARFDAALANMPHGLCTIDTFGKVVIANRRTAELFGARVEQLKLNLPLPEFIGHVGLAHFGPDLQKHLVERCAAWLHGERRALDLDLRDGRQLEMTRNPVPDGSAVIIIEDVTERRESEARILHLARHDPLTGLANRRELHDRLRRMLSTIPPSTVSRPAVFYLDLDGFKSVNDSLGHGAGDEVLTMVAARLRQTLREGELAARLGGDEFAIIVSDSTPLVVSTVARRIIRVVGRPYRLAAGKTVSIGTSIGIALSAPDDAVDELITRADEALYAAKQAGKGTFRVSPREGVLL
jgi:diguanylate cyclase (GGDEF)-like protein